MTRSYLKASVNKFYCKDNQLCRLCTMVKKLLWTCSLLGCCQCCLLLSGWVEQTYFWLLFPPSHTCRLSKIINSPAQLEGPTRSSAPTWLVGRWLSCINALDFGFLPSQFLWRARLIFSALFSSAVIKISSLPAASMFGLWAVLALASHYISIG